jgi:probable LLM family oxidoreductase
MAFEIGIYNFGELTADPRTGRRPDAGRRIQELLEQAEAADRAGLDVFALGEHHRSDFAVSAPAVVLAAAAERTKKIRLSTSVSILSSDDPVRVFQQHATLDLISGGRAEMMVGRGSYIESFPLFGYRLEDYNALFSEKLELILAIRKENPLTWKRGRFRPHLHEADISPRPQHEMPLWVAVGGSPSSVVRVARHGLPMALAIIGGAWMNFKQLVDLYREAAMREGHANLALSVNSPGFVARSREEAFDISYPYFAAGMMQNFHQRDQGIRVSREAFEAQSGPDGALFHGSVEDVAEKIAKQHEMFGHTRFLMQLGFGNVPQEEALKSIELLGKKVAPAVRKAIKARENDQAEKGV